MGWRQSLGTKARTPTSWCVGLLLVFNASFIKRECDEKVQLFKLDGDKAGAMVAWSLEPIAVLPCPRCVLKSLK